MWRSVSVVEMWRSVLFWLLSASLLPDHTLPCYQCLVDYSDSLRLCWGHIITQYNIRNVDECFRKLDRIFNYQQDVIDAGRVGRGYDQQLKNILYADIGPMVEEFDKKRNNDTVYETRLQAAADNFITAASKLPRGFQASGAMYNCVTCQYDSCEFPLDCPVKEIKVLENSRTRMRCDPAFPLPPDLMVIWRFAEEVNTQQVELFEEVTVGTDRLYSIPSAGPHHQGTYQCEIYAHKRSVVRLYYYLAVTPQVVVGHTELQATFDLALLPGGRIVPVSGGPAHALLLLPSPVLLTVCLTALLLLLFISLGALYWWLSQRDRTDEPRSSCPVREVYILH